MLTGLRIDRIEAFANGERFVGVGPYECLTGVAFGALDPLDERNLAIADLALAPRNEAGYVEYETDVFILKPAAMERARGVLLFEVNNRGRKMLLPIMNEAAPTTTGAINDPKSLADAGNRFVFERGYTMAWCGWDPDAPTANQGLSIRVPTAQSAEGPIVQRVRDEFVFGTRVSAGRTSAPLSFVAASTAQHEARLTVREKEGDPRVDIPASQWRFDDARSISLSDHHGFRPGWIYDFWYMAQDPKIQGIGFAATRDFVSFLRTHTSHVNEVGKRSQTNPLSDGDTTAVRKVLAFGNSQSGRYLRHHISLGFNRDENGERVFDGVLTNVAGIGKVFTNERFAQPYRTGTQHEDHAFPENWLPFAHAEQTDPDTGKLCSLLRGDGCDPLIIEVNTATEYWQKGASLLHTDLHGAQDLSIPESVRLFMVASTQHGGRAGLTATPGNGHQLSNPHNPTPALRALLVALEQWVVEGVTPPDSRVPSLQDGQLVTPPEVRFPAVPGIVRPTQCNVIAPRADWVTPSAPTRAYAARVPQVDEDGNDNTGIRLPDVAVPLATLTGWNVYQPPYPQGELCDREGSCIPLARTRQEREETNDPRPSLAERYGDEENYVREVERVVEELANARLLLREDASRFVKEAASKWRVAMGGRD
ncbi:MAG: hypothetical protein K0U93_12275 [Gammaproteobacteria bacterium]|nr:hypothetical protein [Gammaproteobacteria bacterium]